MPRRTRPLPCLVLLAACAHREPAPAAHIATPAPAAVAPSLARPKPPVAKQPMAAEPLREPVNIAAFMQDHFVITSWARDAVAEGDLAALREPLRELSSYRYADVTPGGWMSYLAQLQAAAGLTAQAETRSAAAAGVATMGRVCAECHVHQHVRIGVDLRLPSEPEPETESLSARMFRHQWASARLWEGLTAPSDEAWQRGAAVLAEISLRPPSAAQPLSENVQRMLGEVRALGTRAAQSNTLAERADSYARLLALCADCHASTRPR